MILVLAMGLQSLAASGYFLLSGDYPRALYWFAAALITFATTRMR